MKKERYLKLYDAIEKRPRLRRTIETLNRTVTALVYAFYPLFLIFLLVKNQTGWLRFLLVPYLSFVAVSFLRHRLNAQRPYEKFGVAPLVDKKTKGHSFPSRHTFSIFVIGFSTVAFLPNVGYAIVAMGVLLAACRVLLGLHFIRDVVAGFLCAAAACFIGFILI